MKIKKIIDAHNSTYSSWLYCTCSSDDLPCSSLTRNVLYGLPSNENPLQRLLEYLYWTSWALFVSFNYLHNILMDLVIPTFISWFSDDKLTFIPVDL